MSVRRFLLVLPTLACLFAVHMPRSFAGLPCMVAPAPQFAPFRCVRPFDCAPPLPTETKGTYSPTAGQLDDRAVELLLEGGPLSGEGLQTRTKTASEKDHPAPAKSEHVDMPAAKTESESPPVVIRDNQTIIRELTLESNVNMLLVEVAALREELRELRKEVAKCRASDPALREDLVKTLGEIMLIGICPAQWLLADLIQCFGPAIAVDVPPPAPPEFVVPGPNQPADPRPSDIEVRRADLIKLFEYYWRDGKLKSARRVADEAAKLCPDDPVAQAAAQLSNMQPLIEARDPIDDWLNRFQMDLRADRFSEAEEDAREALKLDPDNPTAKLALAFVLKLRPPGTARGK